MLGLQLLGWAREGVLTWKEMKIQARAVTIRRTVSETEADDVVIAFGMEGCLHRGAGEWSHWGCPARALGQLVITGNRPIRRLSTWTPLVRARPNNQQQRM